MKFLTTILVLLSASFSFAQISATIDFDRSVSSNVFSNYRQLSDNINQITGAVNYDQASESLGVRLYYDGAGSLHEQYDFRNYHLHNLGLSFFNYLSEYGDKLNAGINVSTRLHTDDYKYYEYRQGSGFVSLKIPVTPQLYGYAGTSVTSRSYSALTPYSYWQNVSFVRMSRFFKTGTSLIGEIDYMQKQYSDIDAQPVENFSQLYTDGEGKSQQFVGILKVAQAVDAKTGLSGQVLIRRNLKSSIRYLIDSEGYYFTDDELFDDIFGYNADQFTLTLKHRLPWNMRATLGGAYISKRYSNREALDLEGYAIEGGALRKDLRSSAWLSVQKIWKYSKYVAPVMIELNYSLIQNNSNDPFYDYQSHYFSFGLSQRF